MNEELPAIEEARRTFAAWAAEEILPPAGGNPAEAGAWRQKEWARLAASVAADPEGWWSMALDAVRTATDELVVARRSWLPFEVVLVVGGEPVQRRAADAARDNPRLAAVIFWALRFQAALPGQSSSHEAAVVSLLGLDTAVAAEVRLLTAVQAAPGDMARWNSIDFWPFHLGSRLGSLAPELGWDYVRRLVAAVPDELVAFAGVAELDGFCREAGSLYIDRIEAEASRDPRFRTALGAMLPAGGKVPPSTYARIRRAAGYQD